MIRRLKPRLNIAVVSTVASLAAVMFGGIGSTDSATAASLCKVPKKPTAYGPWRVTIHSFSRDGSNVLKPPAGRVTMAVEVTVSSTKGGDPPGNFLDINLQPKGARRYRGTIATNEAGAAATPKPNEKVRYTVVFPVETKDATKAMSIELNDFSGAISEEKLIPVC